MESALPGTSRDDRRRGPSEVARRQDRPSPGAARRPLPGRERRLFVASLETGGSFLSAHSTDPHPTRAQCRGDPVGRPLGAGHARGARWITCSRGARRWQGDAPRRPYMPCVQPRALYRVPINIAARARTTCRGGSRTAPTMPRNVRGANVAMGTRVHAMIPGHGIAVPRTAHGNARGSDNRPPYRRAMYRRGAGKGKA